MGLVRRGRPSSRTAPVNILNLRTYADVWKDPNPSGEVTTMRFRDLGLPVAFQRQLQAELDARARARDLAGLGEMPYLDCTGYPGDAMTACVDENIKRQQANFAEHDQGQRAIHLANCIRDWKLNHGGSEAGNPCESYTFGSTSPYAQPGYVATPQQVYAGNVPAAVAPPPAATAPPPAANAAPRVTFQNLTRPGQTSALKVGDSWTITITGPTGSSVSVTGGQNGASATTPLGAIDAGGQKVISGQATADQIGQWVERWTVGGQHAGTLNFSISAAGAAATNTAPPATDNSGGGYVLMPAVLDQAGEFATQDVGGFPMWAVLAAGGAALLFFGRR